MQWQKPEKIASHDTIRGVRPDISDEIEENCPKISHYIRWAWAQYPERRPEARELVAGVEKVMGIRR